MLLWELWARNRSLNTWALAALPLWLAVWALLPGPATHVRHHSPLAAFALEAVTPLLYFLPAIFYIVYPITVALHAWDRTKSSSPGLPERFYALPVPTRVLVAVPLISCVAVVAALCALPPLVLTSISSEYWWNVFVILTGVVWFLSLALAVPFRPGWALLMLLVLPPALMFCAHLPGDKNTSYWAALFVRAATVLLFLLGWMAAFQGGCAGRCTDVCNVSAFDDMCTEAIGNVSGRRSGFSSPAAAQIWFESRQLMEVAATVLIMCGSMMLGYHLIWITDRGLGLGFLIITNVIVVPLLFTLVLGASGTGTVLAKADLQSGFLHSTRPFSDSVLTCLKMKAGLRVLATLVATSFGFSVCYLTAIGGWPTVLEGVRSVPFPGSTGQKFAILAAIIVPAYAIVLWLIATTCFSITLIRSRTILLISVFGSVLFVLMLAMLATFYDDPLYAPFVTGMRFLILALVLTGLAFSLWSFKQAITQRLLRAGVLIKAALVWIPIASLYCGALVSWFPCLKLWPESACLGYFALLAFPLTPMAVAPLAMFHARHRR